MATKERWQKAQEYEQGYWEGAAQSAAQGVLDQIDFYEWRAGELTRRLQAVGLGGLVDGEHRIAELGSGPVGILPFLKGREKVAVDPLNRFYSKNEALTKFRTPDVRYLEAGGEAVPLETGQYDLVIMENCIDHVQDVDAVMSEIRRLLPKSGTLYLTVNARSRPGYYVHRLLASLALDPGHPHTFTESRFRAMLDKHGFDVVQFETGSWLEAWKEDWAAPSSRAKLKAALAVSEYLLSAVARKR